MKDVRFIIFTIVLAGVYTISLSTAEMAAFNFVSDTLSTSRPSVAAGHTVKFTTSNQVPASGRIEIVPQDGIFDIPAGLNYSDIDFLVDGAGKTLGAAPGGGAGSPIGVSALGGTSGKIIFTLNDSDSISGGSVVMIRIGNNQRIVNPPTSGAYRVHLVAKNSVGIVLDEADAMVAIIETVLASGSKKAARAPPAAPPSPPAGGGGGGGFAPVTGINLFGRAYPLSRVTVLKDGQKAVTTIAGSDAKFEASLTGLSSGNYNVAVYGEDKKGRRSVLFTFPVYLSYGVLVSVGGIFIAPTIDLDKTEVKRGDDIAIFGASAPQSEITIAVGSRNERFITTRAAQDGVYLYNFNTAPLEDGEHFAKSKAAILGEATSYSQSVNFVVGKKTIAAAPDKCPPKGDLNGDCRVNLVDFSIAAYWWKRPLTSKAKNNVDAKLAPDNIINLKDFSIMAYYWTG